MIESLAVSVPQAMLTSDSNEWYTPAQYAEAVRTVLGHIDVDPASTALANTVIQASTFYDKQSDGWDKAWGKTCFLNPPYGMTLGKSSAALWSQRLVQQYKDGSVTKAILLLKASPGYLWYDDLLQDYLVCTTRGRIRFWNERGKSGLSVQGGAFFYLGSDPMLFAHTFQRFGTVSQNFFHP